MYHSITFTRKSDSVSRNTWNDWKIVPESRPLVNPPEVHTEYIEIPGRDGQLDLSTALTGQVQYGMSTGSWKFIVPNIYEERSSTYNTWDKLYHDIMLRLHGQEVTVSLEDDTVTTSYEGRVFVNQWESSKDYSHVTIEYRLYPDTNHLSR